MYFTVYCNDALVDRFDTYDEAIECFGRQCVPGSGNYVELFEDEDKLVEDWLDPQDENGNNRCTSWDEEPDGDTDWDYEADDNSYGTAKWT